jgi:hypothetical protein
MNLPQSQEAATPEKRKRLREMMLWSRSLALSASQPIFPSCGEIPSRLIIILL